MTAPSLPKSCMTCPSMLAPGAPTVAKFKKSIGAPVCGRYGHVLGKPGLKPGQMEKIAKAQAATCPSWGEPLPPIPQETRLEVVMPDMAARDTDSIDPDKQAACSACQMCKNFVRDDVVADELGWTAGLCAAKGKLIMPNRQVYEARDCQYREYGQIRRTTEGLHLLPIFEDAFALNADPVKSYFKNKGNFVDPKDWPTDREVTSEEHDQGIRAWRKIVDPDASGNEVYLPIYRGDFFTDEERAKIPQAGDDEHPELYIDHFGGTYAIAVMWTELDETPALWGEAGVGKTELFRYLAWLMQLPFERISITASTELDDLAGKMLFEGNETIFRYGRIPLAWAKPCVLCLDEPNVGPTEVWQFIRPLTDNSKQLVLDQNKGERVKRHPDCYFGMAMNPAWDPRNVGALPIADADVSRLNHIFVDMPPESLEREIIANRIKEDGWEIDARRLEMVMKIATELRGLTEQGSIPISWGVRPQIKVARALRWFEPEVAYRRAVGDFLEPEAREALLDVVRANLT
jgi:MoxR-like ATPase